MADFNQPMSSPLLAQLQKRFAGAPVEAANESDPMAAAPESKPFVVPPKPTEDNGGIALPDPKPDPQQSFDPSKYMVSADDLKQAADTKRNVALMGAMTDNLANRQSFGNFFLGHMQPKNDNSAYAKTLESQADQPVQAKQEMMKQEMQKPAMQYMGQAIDPNSELSKTSAAAHGANLQMLKQFNPGMSTTIDGVVAKLQTLSAYQQEQLLDKTGLSKILGSDAMGMARVEAMRAGREQQQQLKAQGTVNSDPILKTYLPRIDGAAKILGLIDSSEHGDVKSNQALLGQLNAEISRLETGSQSPGLHASEKTEMESAAAKLHNVLDTITGNVSGVDLSQKFAQARAMVKELGGSYYRQIDDRMNFLGAGAMPGQKDVFDSKHQQLAYQYAPAFGDGTKSRPGAPSPDTKGAGGVPGVPSANAGQPQAHPQDDQAVQWAKAHPGDPRSAKILKLNGAQ